MPAGALVAVLAFAVLLPALLWRAPQGRALALTMLATLVAFLALRELPTLVPGPRWIGEHWNWAGDLLALTGVLGLAHLLVRRAGFRWVEIGVTARQRPGSLRAALVVTGIVIALNCALMTLSTFRLPSVPAETWLYQAVVPGLVEETVFRGVLLAQADRIFPPRWRLGGAAIGWGGVLVSALFVLLHGVTPNTLTGVAPAALLYLWLRARTGSLVAPILAHNAWNLSVYAAHL